MRQRRNQRLSDISYGLITQLKTLQQKEKLYQRYMQQRTNENKEI